MMVLENVPVLDSVNKVSALLEVRASQKLFYSTKQRIH
jgi:hypothetical protein